MSEGVLWCTKQREQARHPCVNTEGALRARGQHTITTFLEGYSGEREREREMEDGNQKGIRFYTIETTPN